MRIKRRQKKPWTSILRKRFALVYFRICSFRKHHNFFSTIMKWVFIKFHFPLTIYILLSQKRPVLIRVKYASEDSYGEMFYILVFNCFIAFLFVSLLKCGGTENRCCFFVRHIILIRNNSFHLYCVYDSKQEIHLKSYNPVSCSENRMDSKLLFNFYES